MSRRSEAVSRLYREELSCVIEKEGRTYTSDQFGIKPLMQFLRRDRRFFEGAAVADKVVGKAAALLHIPITVDSRPGQGTTFTLHLRQEG